MSHTPGPWKWGEGQGVITAEWNGFPWHIATVDMSELGWHEDEQCKSRENGDNARLIAAAPDLLEALEAMIIGAAACAIPHPKEREVLQMAVDMAIAAKRKAKGIS
jgi:hypothetical protein